MIQEVFRRKKLLKLVMDRISGVRNGEAAITSLWTALWLARQDSSPHNRGYHSRAALGHSGGAPGAKGGFWASALKPGLVVVGLFRRALDPISL